MTKRIPSEQARVATMIRKHMKAHGIAAKVTSSSASMMTEVTVRVSNMSPAAVREIEIYIGQFMYGHFDGMQDMYEHSNTRDDIPQAKFVTLDNRMSDEMRAEAEAFCADYWADWSELNEWDRDNRVHRTLSNDKPWTEGYRFWQARKPRVRAA